MSEIHTNRNANTSRRATSPWISRALAVLFAISAWSISGELQAQTGFCYAAADSENRFVRINEDGTGFLDIGDLGVSSIETIAIQPGTEIVYASNDLGTTGELGVIDPATGAFASIGIHGTCRRSNGSTHAVDDVDSLAFDPLTGILWGVDTSTAGGVLLQIDPLTGAVVPDVFGLNVSCVSISNVNADVDDIAIDPTTGTMYGVDQGNNPDDLVRIDTLTGVATLVGSMGVNDMEGMGMSAGGTLFGTTGSGTESLYTIDKTTGLATLVTAFPSLNDYEGVDCLLGVTASTGDFVWLDVNGDGVQDFGEPGLANVVVRLYVDNNGDGLPDDLSIPPDGTPDAVKQTVTDSNGGYLFDDLPPNNYIVIVDTMTLPNGGVGLSPSTASTAVTLTQGENDLTTDFGFTNSLVGRALIGDKVWTDVDADGLQDPGEIGIAGVLVNLVDPGADGVLGGGDDTVVATTTTVAGGSYLFVNVVPDDYVVEIDSSNFGVGFPLENYTVTFGPQSPGANNSGTFTAFADAGVLDADFGYEPVSPFAIFAITDRIYLDQDWDGTQEAGEPGMFLVTVTLLDAGGDIIATTTTDANGDFTFPGVPNGDYTIQVTDVTDQLNGLRGTTAAGIANSLAVTVSGAPIGPNVSFGYGELGFIGDTVYSDANGNGVQDPGEPGIGGVTVELRDAIGNPIDSDPAMAGIQPTVQTTAPDGFYKFQKVGGGQTGDYFDQFDAIAYDGTNGSFNWQSDPLEHWVETDGLGGGAGAGNISVVNNVNCPLGPANCLQIVANTVNDEIYRQADLSLAASAALNFDFNNQLIASGTTGAGLSRFAAPAGGPFGMAWDGTNLWVADDASFSGVIYEVTTAGAIVSSFAAPCGFPKGVAFDGTDLWIGCDGTDRIYQRTTAGVPVSDIPTPAGLVRGITWDGTNLWVADAGTDRIYEVTTTGTVVSSFAVPVVATDPRGLTFDGTSLWLADNATDSVYELTTTGTELSNFAVPAAANSPRGLTFDGTDFWLSDNGTDEIYQLEGPTTSAVVQVSGDGGGSWTTLAKYGWSNPGLGNASFDITPFIAANTRIRLVVTNSEGGGSLFVDNVQIFLIETGTAGPTTYRVVVTDTGSVLSGFTQTGDPDEAGACTVCNNQGTASVGNFLQNDNPSSDLTMDFGYRDVNTGTISGSLFEDSDLDGIDDGAADPPLAGIVVYLLDAGGNIIATTVTDSNGNYSFVGVSAGTYTVVVDESTLPANLNTQTLGPGPVNLSAGETESGIDFGYGQIVTNPVTLRSFKTTTGPNEGDVLFAWSTSTETGNMGFNLYAKHEGQWSKVNARPIVSKVIDSVTIQEYSYQAYGVMGTLFALVDIDTRGKETVHGPFQLGHAHGQPRVERKKIDWQSIGAEHKAKKEARKQKRQKRMKEAGQPNSLKRRTLAGLPSMGLNLINFGVNQDGVYRVTYEELLGAGLDLAGIHVSRIGLTNQGKPVPVRIKAQASTGRSPSSAQQFGPGAYLEFVGHGTETLYTDTNVYTLHVGMDGRSGASVAVDNAGLPQGATPAPFYMETVTVEQQAQYDFGSPTDDPWYAARMLAWGGAFSQDFNITVDEYLDGAAPVTVSVGMWGVTDWPSSPDHHVQLSFNGTQVADEWFDGYVDYPVNAPLPVGALQEGTNTLNVSLPLDTGEQFDLVNLDHYSVTYPRRFVARDGALTFTASGELFTVENLTSDRGVVVYRVTADAVQQVQVLTDGRGNRASFAGSLETATYHVVAVDSLQSVELMPAQPYTDITSGDAEYLIIAHPDFINTDLQLLAQERQGQFTVKVVDVEDIYAQFGYALFDPQSIRDYIAHAYTQMGTRYVLLVGGDTHDYHDYLGQAALSFIPSLYAQTDDFVTFAPVDPKYADVDDDNVPDLAIGRFPVRTAADLQTMVNQTLAYGQKNYGKTAVFAADEFDVAQNYRFTDDSEAMIGDHLVPNGWSVTRAYIDGPQGQGVQGAKTTLIDAINNGVALTSFFGHSGLIDWTFAGLFNSNDAAALHNTGQPTVVTQWGCWNTYYVSPYEETLGHQFMLNGNRAAAVLGASTLTEAAAERELAHEVFARILQPGMTMGQAILDAKRAYAQARPTQLDVILGWIQLGDPALVVESP